MEKKKKVLLGNEAVVKGALASGVDYVSGYPGCPSAEIGDEFGKIAKENGVYAEWATNEKVGLESAIGASFSGLKSLVNMKSFGINVCSDSLFPLAYTGTKAPMVIFVGDDPSCHSSAQSEQDSRGYAYLSHIPVLDPSTPQECYDFTKLGYEISEKFNVPVILRSTTRVAHQRAPVSFIVPDKTEFQKGDFVKNPYQFCTMPPRVMEMKTELLEKIKEITAFAEKSKINEVTGKKTGVTGIVTTGVAFLHVMEALKELGLDMPVLKLGFFYPLPEKMILNFLKGKKKVLVAEELEPYLETEIKKIAKDANPKLKIHGKDLLPEVGELNTEKIISALSKITGKKFTLSYDRVPYRMIGQIPRRTARLCEGCPYWHVFPIIKRIAPEGTIFGGDIGCNMIAGLPPHNIQDYLFSMGASMGISHGVSKATNQKVISIIGDGTFFHAGMPGLVNAVYNKSNPLIIVLDNRITAMTGHQQNPGMGKTAMGENVEEIKIEEIAKVCGVKHIKVLDPINMKELEEAIKDFLQKDEVSIIICRRICALLERRLKSNPNLRKFYGNL
ncbi:MAG: thiamine pyrophosphate-dependent enzyme [Candidatus Staskawiczbacteria bacterium]|nr:thiamine pyrophosphate-dependent enzyme [Candidatus Staskawiczbacteria bacterium]